MTVFLMVGSTATDPNHQDLRAALQRRGELTTMGANRDRADVVVGQLPPGARVVPGEIATAARESLASGVLLLASEPMIRPVTPVGSGNVVLVSPQRTHVLSALDILLGAPTSQGGHQALLRHSWSGWAVGSHELALDHYQTDAAGATFVHAQGPRAKQSAALVATQMLGAAQTDARRSSLLREALGTDVQLVHLAPGGGTWLVHWTHNSTPLWLCSSLRMPARWSVSAALAASGAPFVRLSAFPGDLMISTSIPDQEIRELLDKISLGALDIFRALERLVHRPTDWGFVLEVR
jgi:hypothetical protein